MAIQAELLDRWLLDRYKLNAECHEDHVIHTSYVPDPARGRSKIKVERVWQQVEEIGNGSFGEVWLQKHASESRAVKILGKKRLASQGIDYRRELEALAKFEDKSANWREDAIIKFFGWYESNYKIYLAMEYFELGDFGRYIASEEILERDAKDITVNLLEGLKIMHVEGFTHRDLKPQNIFVVTKSPRWWVKIGDFGISKRIDPAMTALRTENRGTPLFMAPEIIPEDYQEESSIYTNTVDIWSLGCVVYNILAKQPPFSSNRAKRRPFPRAPLEGRTDPTGLKFLERLILLDPACRATAEAALNDAWLESGNVAAYDQGGVHAVPSVRPKVAPASSSAHDSIYKDDTKIVTQTRIPPLEINQINLSTPHIESPIPSVTLGSKAVTSESSGMGRSLVSHFEGQGGNLPAVTQPSGTNVSIQRTISPSHDSCETITREFLSAVRGGNDSEVKRALLAGADVNAKYRNSERAVDCAAIDGNINILNRLLDHGATIGNEECCQPTLLLVAAFGSDRVLSALLRKGADINARDSKGYTALHRAALTNRKSAVKLLLAAGADIDLANDYGQTALHIAEAYCNEEIAQMITLSTARKTGASFGKDPEPSSPAPVVNVPDIPESSSTLKRTTEPRTTIFLGRKKDTLPHADEQPESIIHQGETDVQRTGSTASSTSAVQGSDADRLEVIISLAIVLMESSENLVKLTGQVEEGIPDFPAIRQDTLDFHKVVSAFCEPIQLNIAENLIPELDIIEKLETQLAGCQDILATITSKVQTILNRATPGKDGLRSGVRTLIMWGWIAPDVRRLQVRLRSGTIELETTLRSVGIRCTTAAHTLDSVEEIYPSDSRSWKSSSTE